METESTQWRLAFLSAVQSTFSPVAALEPRDWVVAQPLDMILKLDALGRCI
jgi:hypothetical protein